MQAVVAANADARDSQAKANEATARAQVAETQVGAVSQSLADVQAKHDDLASSHLDRITDNLQEAAAIGQTLSNLLPGSFGKSVGEAAGALSGTLTTITELAQRRPCRRSAAGKQLARPGNAEPAGRFCADTGSAGDRSGARHRGSTHRVRHHDPRHRQ